MGNRKICKGRLTHYFIFAVLALIPCLLLLNSSPLDARATEFKYTRNYSTGLHPQNWSIVRDKRGIIYVANNRAVLEWEGVSMRHINIPNWTVRSLAIADNDTIYVGGVNELGYLTPAADGMRYYISLLDYLGENQKNFSTVFRIKTTKDAVYFRTSKFLFKWNRETKKMDVWQPETKFSGLFTSGGLVIIIMG